MSDIKRSILGIIMVIIGISLLLGSGGGPMPWIGGLIGLIGAFLFLRTLFRGNLK